MKEFTRRALIVSSWLRVDSTDFRLGVKADVTKVKAFLKSGYGGSFIESAEIWHLHRPPMEELARAMAWVAASDYAFVYYSGHGMSKGQVPFVALDERMSFKVETLASLAPRQITIIDTCRNEVGPYSLLEGISGPYGDIDVLPWDFAREAFAGLMQRQPLGRVLIQSSSFDQSSYSTSNGGIFTNALMAAMEPFYRNGTHGLLKTGAAFRMARREMAKVAEFAQRPEMRQTSGLGDAGLLFAIQPEVLYRGYLRRVG